MANPKVPKGYQGTYAKNPNGGGTLIMVTREVNTDSNKGVTTMAKGSNQPAPATNNGNGNNEGFTPTFRKFKDMSESEQAAFRQGCKTSENKVKERLGFTKPKN